MLPAAALQFRGRIEHRGNNVWLASAIGEALTAEEYRTVTNYLTVTRQYTVTRDITMQVPVTAHVPSTRELTYDKTKEMFEEFTREVTHDSGATVFTAYEECTVTKQITATAEAEDPVTAVTKVVTRERTVTAPCPWGFIVTAIPVISRGAAHAFDLEIQAYNWVTGELDTTYVPTGALTITLFAPSDPLDFITPANTSNAGWVNGRKTVPNVSIQGGAGADVATIWVIDPNSCREGTLEVVIDSPATVRNWVSSQRYYAQVTTGPPINAANWALGQTTSQANFEADVVLGVNATAARDVTRNSALNVCWCDVGGPYGLFTLNAADKVNPIASFAVIQVYGERYDAVALTYHDNDHSFRRKLWLYLSESAATFGSGLAMKNMTPHVEIEFTQIDRMQAMAGGAPGAWVDIKIPIPPAFIQAMAGVNLYIWMYIVNKSNIPYVAPYDAGKQNNQCIGTFQNKTVEIYH